MKWHENLAGAYNLVISHTHALLQLCIVTSYIVMITVGVIARCWQCDVERHCSGTWVWLIMS